MGNYYKYIAVYKTEILSVTDVTYINDPVKIEVFDGPRIFQIGAQFSRIFPAGKNSNISSIAP